MGHFPFIVGGSNDQSFYNASGINESLRIINIDAHLDVKKLIDGKVHSGSPFRQLMLSNKQHDLIEFATQDSEPSHVDFVTQNGGRIIWYDDIKDDPLTRFVQETTDDRSTKNIFVSFDMDSIRFSDCPGVSCPATLGLSAENALDIAYSAGKNSHVVLFDLSELNPMIEDYASPKLAANIFHNFCSGFIKRNM